MRNGKPNTWRRTFDYGQEVRDALKALEGTARNDSEAFRLGIILLAKLKAREVAGIEITFADGRVTELLIL